MPLQCESYALSHQGLVRLNNEDYWARIPDENFFIVADGMGGHRAGEVASKETSRILCELCKEILITDPDEEQTAQEARHLLCLLIEDVNRQIYKLARSNKKYKGMGTTLCCSYLCGEQLVYAHVGDSRIYLLRDGKLKQLTKDHSLARRLMDMGQLNEKNRKAFAYKNIITRAIGLEDVVEPSVSITDVLPGDQFLLCTDGLSDMVSDEEIEAIVNDCNNDGSTLEEISSALIDKAIKLGGKDNVTVMMLGFKGDED
jgi:serine/threonine protein phosphatase PrpC